MKIANTLSKYQDPVSTTSLLIAASIFYLLIYLLIYYYFSTATAGCTESFPIVTSS